MNNPFTAGFPHTGLPGGYSVELVCQTLIYYSGLYTFSDQHHYLLHLALTVAMNHDYSTTFMCFFFSKIYPHRFPGGAGVSNPAQVCIHQFERSFSTYKKKNPPQKSPNFFSLILILLLPSFSLQPFSSFGLIKYSIPQLPGRQSVEVVSHFSFLLQIMGTFGPGNLSAHRSVLTAFLNFFVSCVFTIPVLCI